MVKELADDGLNLLVWLLLFIATINSGRCYNSLMVGNTGYKFKLALKGLTVGC